jgi:ferredoxin
MQSHKSWSLPHINKAHCTGCGICAQSCPTQAVVVRGGTAAIIHPSECTFCEICEARCPSGAIGRPFTITFAADDDRSPAK